MTLSMTVDSFDLLFTAQFEAYILENHRIDLLQILQAEDAMQHFGVTVK